MSVYVDLGGCAGDHRLMPANAFDRVRAKLAKMLESEGPQAVSDYYRQCQAGTLGVTGADEALILSIVETRPDGSIYLRTKDDFALNLNRAA